MGKLPYMPLWTSDFFADTRFLTTTQVGMHTLLLIEAWARPDCRLPDDPEQLRRFVRVNKKVWRRDWPVVSMLWVVNGNFLQNESQLIQREKSLARRKRSSKAAEQRWEHRDVDASDEQINGSTPISGYRVATSRTGRAWEEMPYGHFPDEIYDQVRRVAPGFDPFEIERRWRYRSRNMRIHNPIKAYIEFSKEHVRRNRPLNATEDE